VFGGWAEELRGVIRPRPHRDVDLLVVDPDLGRLDEHVAARGEIGGKRFSHKRAFTVDGVLVELFLVFGGSTTFFDAETYVWPPLGIEAIDGLDVVSTEVLSAYRRNHERLVGDHAV
jgi:hypothetical protein